jgi:hypothetical protein
MEGIIPVEADDLFEICEYALGECKFCRLSNDQATACPRRAIFLKYDIPYFDEEAQGCPYKISIGGTDDGHIKSKTETARDGTEGKPTKGIYPDFEGERDRPKNRKTGKGENARRKGNLEDAL